MHLVNALLVKGAKMPRYCKHIGSVCCFISKEEDLPKTYEHEPQKCNFGGRPSKSGSEKYNKGI